MKKLILFGLLVFTLQVHAQSMRKVQSPLAYSTTCSQLEKAIQKAGLKLFATYDHSLEASAVGLTLDSLKVYVLGNPKAGTLLMQTNPAIAHELPLRISVYRSKQTVHLQYIQPESWIQAYGLESQAALLAKMETLLAGLCADAIRD